MVYHLWARRENCAQRNSLTGATKYSRVHDASHYCIVGVFNGEGPPVPIPNTEVKLISGDDTWLATARENSTALTQRSSCENAVASIFYSVASQVRRTEPEQKSGIPVTQIESEIRFEEEKRPHASEHSRILRKPRMRSP